MPCSSSGALPGQSEQLSISPTRTGNISKCCLPSSLRRKIAAVSGKSVPCCRSPQNRDHHVHQGVVTQQVPKSGAPVGSFYVHEPAEVGSRQLVQEGGSRSVLTQGRLLIVDELAPFCLFLSGFGFTLPFPFVRPGSELRNVLCFLLLSLPVAGQQVRVVL